MLVWITFLGWKLGKCFGRIPSKNFQQDCTQKTQFKHQFNFIKRKIKRNSTSISINFIQIAFPFQLIFSIPFQKGVNELIGKHKSQFLHFLSKTFLPFRLSTFTSNEFEFYRLNKIQLSGLIEKHLTSINLRRKNTEHFPLRY